MTGVPRDADPRTEGGPRGGETAPATEEDGPPPPGEPWTVLRLIRWSGRYLEGKGIREGRLDAEHLLGDVLRKPRLELYLAHDRPVSDGELEAFKARLRRRARREPLQYVLGTAPFREVELRCDPRALIPRPETEELVEAVLEWLRERGDGDARALDVGTGSGAIAVSLAREGGLREVVATDADPEALALAAENARKTGVQETVSLRRGGGLEPIEAGERFDVVVSNPPYVAEREWEALEPEVRDWEPRGALVPGATGLEFIEALLAGVAEALAPGGLLALEVGAEQSAGIARRLEGTEGFRDVRVLADRGGVDRIVLAERTETRGSSAEDGNG